MMKRLSGWFIVCTFLLYAFHLDSVTWLLASFGAFVCAEYYRSKHVQ